MDDRNHSVRIHSQRAAVELMYDLVPIHYLLPEADEEIEHPMAQSINVHVSVLWFWASCEWVRASFDICLNNMRAVHMHA